MPDRPEASFSIVFKKLGEFDDSAEVMEAIAITDEAEEIQDLRRIIEEANTADCVEFSTT